ncbi:alpha/beta-hydrolase [Artomyces pyxidatus]|uniref:Alpha/beta-hydrolase n=1 Tax=Artomyces pyxidatus TaxID=48021 RepID=A0ACB8SN45_9AGAM|nr:alpha/beta-hydrolase [Artomyces pyxidatus]
MSDLDIPDPEWAPIAETLPTSFDPDIKPEAEQEHWVNVIQPALAAIIKPDLPDESKYRVEDHKVPSDSGGIRVRVVIPAGGAEATYPLVVWIHGGGWVVGNIDQDDYFTRVLSVELQATIVNVEYRLAPQNPFPAGLNDCYAAVKWVRPSPCFLPIFISRLQAASNADRLSVSLQKGFVVGGQSAGANLSAVIAHRALADPFFRDKPLTGQHLSVPPTLRYEAYPDKCVYI